MPQFVFKLAAFRFNTQVRHCLIAVSITRLYPVRPKLPGKLIAVRRRPSSVRPL